MTSGLFFLAGNKYNKKEKKEKYPKPEIA